MDEKSGEVFAAVVSHVHQILKLFHIWVVRIDAVLFSEDFESFAAGFFVDECDLERFCQLHGVL